MGLLLGLTLSTVLLFQSCQQRSEKSADRVKVEKNETKALPKGFVYVNELIPDAVIDIRYQGKHNFIGRQIRGYNAPEAILTEEATLALKNVQDELKQHGLGIKIYDAYRPQQAVDHFKEWARDLDDTLMKQEFYPEIDKADLFKLGYIAERSGHSRGSTVDLTIIHLDTGKEWDMGTDFDFFGPASGHGSHLVSSGQEANRLFLKNLMIKHGFKPYEAEWWHYTLHAEPFSDTYYDFPVQ